MGFRRSKARIAAHGEWRSFIARNAGVIGVAGLPEAITGSLGRWDDFLLRGTADLGPDRGRYSVDRLSETQYAALIQLVDSYFSAGNEYFTPQALRGEDRQWLEARHGPGGD